jgi:hypothetical protein
MNQFIELQIAEAAIEWESARQEVLRLKRARNALRCTERSEAEYDERGQLTHEAEPPCWEVQTYPDGYSLPLEQRCEACQQNHVAHLAVKKAIADCGGRLRRLRRLLAKVSAETTTVAA